MKTYESEKSELTKWIKGKNEEYIKKCKISLENNEKGYDGELYYDRESERKLAVQEYNRRLAALKKKYGKDMAAQKTVSNNDATRVHI